MHGPLNVKLASCFNSSFVGFFIYCSTCVGRFGVNFAKLSLKLVDFKSMLRKIQTQIVGVQVLFKRGFKQATIKKTRKHIRNENMYSFIMTRQP